MEKNNAILQTQIGEMKSDFGILQMGSLNLQNELTELKVKDLYFLAVFLLLWNSIN